MTAVPMSLLHATLAALLSLAAAGAAWSQTVLKVAHPVGIAQTPFQVGTTVFCDRVAKNTRKRYRCEMSSGSQGSEEELVDSLQKGRLDVVNVSAAPLARVAPRLGMLEIPFLFRGFGDARKALDGPAGAELLKSLLEQHLVGLAWSDNGFRHIGTTTRPVRRAGDLDGLKLRTATGPTAQAGYKALGVVPTAVPYPELADALRQRRVDGHDSLIPIAAVSGLAPPQKHLTLTHHIYSPALIVLSEKLWQGLGAADRKVFASAAKSAAAAQRREVLRAQKRGLSVLKRNGVRIVTAVDAEDFRRALAPAYAEYAKAFGPETIAQLQNRR